MDDVTDCHEWLAKIGDAFHHASIRLTGIGARLTALERVNPYAVHALMPTYGFILNELDEYRRVQRENQITCAAATLPLIGPMSVWISNEGPMFKKKLIETYNTITIWIKKMIDQLERKIENIEEGGTVVDTRTDEGMDLWSKMQQTKDFFTRNYNDLPVWLRRKYDPIGRRITAFDVGDDLPRLIEELWADVHSLPGYHDIEYSQSPPQYSLPPSYRSRSRPTTTRRRTAAAA